MVAYGLRFLLKGQKEEVVEVPTVIQSSDEEGLEQRYRTAWVVTESAPCYEKPGLNFPVLKELPQWEELSWLNEESNWDKIQTKRGKIYWTPSANLTFIRPANLINPSSSEKFVMRFYQAVMRKNFSNAYELLSREWQEELPFASFVRGYEITDSLRTEITSVEPLTQELDTGYRVVVSMMAVEEGRDVPYEGIYTVESNAEGQLRMTSGRLNKNKGDVSPLSRPSSKTEEPSATKVEEEPEVVDGEVVL